MVPNNGVGAFLASDFDAEWKAGIGLVCRRETLLRAFVVIGVCLSLASMAYAQEGAANPDWNTMLQSVLLWGGVPLLVAVLLIWLETFVRKPLLRRKESAPEPQPAGIAPLVAALSVLGVLLAITAYLAYSAAHKLKYDAWMRYQFEADRVEEGMQRYFDSVLPALRGVRGAAAIGVRFEQDQLQRWMAARDLELEFPGVLGLGVAGVALEKTATSPRVVFKGPLLLEPSALSPSISARTWDWGGPLNETLQRAAHSGRAALSTALPIQREGVALQALLYVLPVYADGVVPPTPEQRMEQLRSVAFSVIHLTDFLAGLDAASRGMVAFEVRDGMKADTSRLVFHSDRLGRCTLHPDVR